MKNSIFILSLVMLIYSCGKEIANAIASSPSNVTTAPWRGSRTKIEATASNSEKDSICISEFGSDYVSGTNTEYLGYSQNTSAIGHGSPGITVANSDEYFANYFPHPGPFSVFCIHK